MDIQLGKIGVTSRQISNSHSLMKDPIKGFGAVDDDVVVVTTRELTDQEKSELIEELKKLPDEDRSRLKRIERLDLTTIELFEAIKSLLDESKSENIHPSDKLSIENIKEKIKIQKAG